MYKCDYCANTYSQRQGLYRHKKNCPVKNQEPKKINIKPKEKSIELIHDGMVELREQVAKLTDVVSNSSNVSTSPVTGPNITNNITNNINVYFNKDLKYYPELVKILGKKGTCNYLLFTMPESRDIFGVLDKILINNGITNCPIKLDDGQFMIARGENEYIYDPTGEIIDKENKYKLQDAVITAYVDSTRQIDEECDNIREKRLNSQYTDADMEILNRRFNTSECIEPSRPYEVIDIMNNIKPKKKDFDKLRKLCPAVTKKIIC